MIIRIGSESIGMCREYVRAFTNLHVDKEPVTITFDDNLAAKRLLTFIAASDRLDCQGLIFTLPAWSLVQEKLNLKFGLISLPENTPGIKGTELVKSIGVSALIIQRAKFLVEDFLFHTENPFEELVFPIQTATADCTINKSHPLAFWCIKVLKVTNIEDLPQFPFQSVSEKQAREFADCTGNALIKKLLTKRDLPWKKIPTMTATPKTQ